jgi:hypothetical protein
VGGLANRAENGEGRGRTEFKRLTQYHTVSHSITQCHTVSHSITQYHTVSHSITQHSDSITCAKGGVARPKMTSFKLGAVPPGYLAEGVMSVVNSENFELGSVQEGRAG